MPDKPVFENSTFGSRAGRATNPPQSDAEASSEVDEKQVEGSDDSTENKAVRSASTKKRAAKKS